MCSHLDLKTLKGVQGFISIFSIAVIFNLIGFAVKKEIKNLNRAMHLLLCCGCSLSAEQHIVRQPPHLNVLQLNSAKNVHPLVEACVLLSTFAAGGEVVN